VRGSDTGSPITMDGPERSAVLLPWRVSITPFHPR
jgi:hypothetical protein